MTNRKHHLTARIKPATKHALMAQLALAADEIERQRIELVWIYDLYDHTQAKLDRPPRPWWRRLLGLR